MGLTDRLKDLTKKVEGTVGEHKDQIQQAVGKASAAVDKRTGGKYHEQIQKAEAKTEGMINKLDQSEPKTNLEADASGPEDGASTSP